MNHSAFGLFWKELFGNGQQFALNLGVIGVGVAVNGDMSVLKQKLLFSRTWPIDLSIAGYIHCLVDSLLGCLTIELVRNNLSANFCLENRVGNAKHIDQDERRWNFFRRRLYD